MRIPKTGSYESDGYMVLSDKKTEVTNVLRMSPRNPLQGETIEHLIKEILKDVAIDYACLVTDMRSPHYHEYVTKARLLIAEGAPKITAVLQEYLSRLDAMRINCLAGEYGKENYA